MEFCYLHPENEASGQCSNCERWICKRDYNLVKENIGERKETVERSGFTSRFINRGKRTKEIIKIVTGPVVYCTRCFELKNGLDSEINPTKDSESSKKRILMCNQCGEKLKPGDQFCPGCGESTEDEMFDASHPIKGLQASKRLK